MLRFVRLTKAAGEQQPDRRHLATPRRVVLRVSWGTFLGFLAVFCVVVGLNQLGLV